MRYNRVWATLVRKAVREGGIDLATFVERGVEGGMSEGAIQQRLLDDLESNGPVFGRFFRALEGSASASTMAAYRQGENLGNIDGSKQLKRLLGLRESVNEFGSVVDVANPDAMQEIADAVAERDERTWIAELRNTCHLCLPLHGVTRTMAQWNELGLHPDSIHQSRGGFDSPCYCRLVPAGQVDRVDAMRPLVRNKLEDPLQRGVSKKTKRGVTQVDLDRSVAAAEKAMLSEVGRRTLRVLGQAATVEPEES